jgi:TPP-dependent 2-oxoacid decarboxylase
MATQYTVGAYLLDRLKELGIRHIFGVPGDYGFPFMDRIEADPDIAWVGTCNELNGSYAADGYARGHGIAAFVGSCGVADFGASGGIAGAYAEWVPVIFISCYPPTQAMAQKKFTHHSLHGDFAAFARIYQEMTVAQALLTEHNACQEIDRVLQAGWSEKLPVYIRLPKEVEALPAHPPTTKLVLAEPVSDPAHLEAFLARLLPLLTAAHHPVMLVDFPVGRYHLTELVQTFAQKTGIPFAATSIAKSAFLDETHPLYLGMYQGHVEGSAVDQQIETADLLLRLCLQQDERNTGYAAADWHAPHVVDLQVRSASIATEHYADVALRDVLMQVSTQLSQHPFAFPAPPARRSLPPFEPEPATAITQDRLWQRFSQFLQEDDVLVVDDGTCAVVTQIALPARARVVMQPTWEAIGYSVPAVLGAHLADPHHRHILVVGDGAFQETAQELSTILRQGLAPIILLLNNGHYVIENFLREGGFKDMGYNKLQTWNYHQLPMDFASVQKPVGLRVTTEEELETAFAAAAQAQREGRCALIEVVLAANDIPRPVADAVNALVEATGK